MSQNPSPIAKTRKRIESDSEANIYQCWTCSGCDIQCPINLATNRLRPQKIVRLANFGFIEELLSLPEIWYCQNCRQCDRICPNRVKPSRVIEQVRKRSLSEGRISLEKVRMRAREFSDLQRTRWWAVRHCLEKKSVPVSRDKWAKWRQTPVPETDKSLNWGSILSAGFRFQSLKTFRVNTCFTCGECAGACPVAVERAVFEPRSIFRMAALGIVDELLRSPSLWICVQCGRCTDACSQLVDCREMIQELRNIAVSREVVDKFFLRRLEQMDKILYSKFVDRVDEIFGF